MKKKTDPRHLRRIKLMQDLFAWNFNQKNPETLIKPVTSHLKKIDQKISQSAPERPIEQINQIDLAILRLSVFELIIESKQPPKVIVDEAVELGKEFGSDSSAAFINGALGKLIESEGIKT